MFPDAEGTLDDVYFEWLYGQIGSVINRNPYRSYWKLAHQFYTKEFVWLVANDDNRVADGKDLRKEFLSATGYILDGPDTMWMDLPCSFLEILIVLARIGSFETEEDPITWFWRFMHNLELDRYSDAIYEISIEEEVEEAMERVIYRTYSESGVGGLFPLRTTDINQRTVELWYQMSAYIIEGLYIHHTPHAS